MTKLYLCFFFFDVFNFALNLFIIVLITATSPSITIPPFPTQLTPLTTQLKRSLSFEHTVFKKLGISERKGVSRRLGSHNLYDEVSAVNYYELDLSNPQMR